MVIGFADWRMPSGASTPVFVVGSDLRRPGLRPWNIVAGSDRGAVGSPTPSPSTETYFERLGVTEVGDEAEIRQQRRAGRGRDATASARSPRRPMCSSTSTRARTYTGIPASKATYFLVRLQPGRRCRTGALVDLQAKAVRRRGADPDGVPRAQPHVLAVRHRRGRGAVRRRAARRDRRHGDRRADALFEHQGSSRTSSPRLRAIGSSNRYIYKVIICQALLSAVIGFCLASVIGFVVVYFTSTRARCRS